MRFLAYLVLAAMLAAPAAACGRHGYSSHCGTTVQVIVVRDHGCYRPWSYRWNWLPIRYSYYSVGERCFWGRHRYADWDGLPESRETPVGARFLVDAPK